MFRRCVTLLVIVGFLASQLAAMPHAHRAPSAVEQQKHDAKTHFHSEWFCHAEDGHSHSGHGHSHPGQRHEGGQEAPTSDNSDGLLLGICLSGADHDSDAIFVPGRVAAAFSSNNRVVGAWQLAALAALPDCLGDHKASPSPSPQLHPPDEVLDGSDTYLTLRNLRL